MAKDRDPRMQLYRDKATGHYHVVVLFADGQVWGIVEGRATVKIPANLAQNFLADLAREVEAGKQIPVKE